MGRDRPDAAPAKSRGGVRARVPRWEVLAALAVTALALTLRLVGIGWGLPNAQRFSSYHPDEGVNLINGVLIGGFPRFHLDIAFYNYGSLYFLLWQVACVVNGAYNLVQVPLPASGVPASYTLGAMILVGRCLSAVFGAATCMILWWCGRLIGRPWAGIVAAGFYAVAPLAVVHGHFATVDVTATFLVAATQASALVLLTRPERSPALGAGLLAGLAAATRYNAVLAVAMPVVAVWLARPNEGSLGAGQRLKLIGFAVAACLVGFLIGCPGAMLNWPRFSQDFLYELHKSRAGMGLLFEGTGTGWVYHYLVSLRHGLGWPLLAVASLSVAAGIVRRRPYDLVLLTFVAIYYLAMGTAQVRFARYMLPLLPAIFLLVGSLVTEGHADWYRRLLVSVRLAVVLAATAGLHAGVAYSLHMTRTDARDLAAEYLRTRVPAKCHIAFATVPWYWSPPLMPEFTAPIPGQARRRLILQANQDGRLLLPGPEREWDLDVLRTSLPTAVVLSDLESQDAIRLKVPEAVAFLRMASAGRKQVTFGARPTLFGVRAASDGYLPNDMLYVCPRITVYLPASF